jgi:polysaccharide export outer membrane protein
VVLKHKKTLSRFIGAPRSLGVAAAVLLLAGLSVMACTQRQTGIYALPMAPQTTPNVGASPQTGPTNVPDKECRQSTGDYRLGAGDKIRVVVLSDTEFSADYEVNATGAISARMIGNVDVTGKTPGELEQILRDRYTSAGYLRSPRLGVELVSTRPFFVIGEVARSGNFPYISCLRVIQAIAIAGGFTRRASRTRVTIRRFFSNFAEEEYVTEDTLVEPGDVIRVPERWF